MLRVLAQVVLTGSAVADIYKTLYRNCFSVSILVTDLYIFILNFSPILIFY